MIYNSLPDMTLEESYDKVATICNATHGLFVATLRYVDDLLQEGEVEQARQVMAQTAAELNRYTTSDKYRPVLREG
jgi:soluble cytochrome b562